MHRSLPLRGEAPAHAGSAPRLAIARKGFRPFFLLAAAFASAIVPVWLLLVSGALPPGHYLDATTWHAHEMVFGFAVAVLAGFLLTAAGNWTQRETLVGAPLLGLAALWLVGRIAMAAPEALPRGVPAAVDLAFLPALVVVLARPIVAARNWRNLVMLAALGALFVANAVVHCGALGVLAADAPRRACLVAVDVIVVVVLVIAGRVFPMFTRNATGATDVRSHPTLDVLAIAGAGVFTVFDAVDHGSRIAALTAGIAGVLAAARSAHWGMRHTLTLPLLWILHVGYAWIPLGLLLRGLAAFAPVVPASLATHALTVGAIGSLTLGMMARVALGHTGRPLVAPRPMAWAFGAVTGAAVVRVALPLVAPAAYFASLVAAGALWTAAFLAYLVAYAPVLLGPRLDGKQG